MGGISLLVVIVSAVIVWLAPQDYGGLTVQQHERAFSSCKELGGKLEMKPEIACVLADGSRRPLNIN